MIDPVSISVDLSPFIVAMIVRLVCLAIGITAFIHFMLMATSLPKQTSLCVTAVIGLISGSSVGLILGSLTGDINTMIISFTGLSGSFILWALWIWAHGFHMNEFVAKILQNK